jgi:hypothetical protein
MPSKPTISALSEPARRIEPILVRSIAIQSMIAYQSRDANHRQSIGWIDIWPEKQHAGKRRRYRYVVTERREDQDHHLLQEQRHRKGDENLRLVRKRVSMPKQKPFDNERENRNDGRAEQ